MTLNEAYQFLGVTESSTSQEIKKAYRTKAILTHPDKGGSAKDFIMVQAAYEIICKFNIQAGGEGLPIPDELKEVISQLVNEFQNKYISIEQDCNEKLNKLKVDLFTYIDRTPRRHLYEYNQHFISLWESTLRSLFHQFNQDCNNLLKKYETWFKPFTEDLELIFEKEYREEIKNYKHSPTFYIISVVWTFILGYIIFSTDASFLSQMGWLITLDSLFILGTWRLACLRNKKMANEVTHIQVLTTAPFSISSDADFEASSALKQGFNSSVMAAKIGAAIGFALGGTAQGAIIGLAVSEIANRIMHSTSEVKSSLKIETGKFIDTVRPDIINYSLQSHQQFMAQIHDKVIQNYEARVKQSVKMIT